MSLEDGRLVAVIEWLRRAADYEDHPRKGAGRIDWPELAREIADQLSLLTVAGQEKAPQTGGCSRTPNTCTAPFCGYPDCLMGSTTPATKQTAGTITAVSGDWVYWLGVGWRTTKPSPDAVAVNRPVTLQM